MDINKLINSAKASDGLGDGNFDTFLRLKHYDEKDTSERILMDDLFIYYSEYFYNKYKKLPHRFNFTEQSVIYETYKIRQRQPKDKTKLAWGLKCSSLFKETFNLWQQKSEPWLKKHKQILNGKRTKKLKKLNQQQNQQLDTKLNSLLALIKDTSAK